jgi:hypothetical protein
MEPEILVNISFHLPQADRKTLAEHIAPLMHLAVVTGGDTVTVSLQPYTPEEDDD